MAAPLRCYNCQRIGHTASGCDARKRCLICSGEHSKDLCNINADIIRRANCGGPHIASSNTCEFLKEAKEIEQYVSEGKTFTQVKNIILNKKRENHSHLQKTNLLTLATDSGGMNLELSVCQFSSE